MYENMTRIEWMAIYASMLIGYGFFAQSVYQFIKQSLFRKDRHASHTKQKTGVRTEDHYLCDESNNV